MVGLQAYFFSLHNNFGVISSKRDKKKFTGYRIKPFKMHLKKRENGMGRR